MGVQEYYPGERIGSFSTGGNDPLTSAGYVVKLSAGSTDHIVKAEMGEAWLGVNIASTEDPNDSGTFFSGANANVAVATDGIVQARACSDNVSAGMPLVVLSSGEVSGLVTKGGGFTQAATHILTSAAYALVGYSVGDASDNFIEMKLK